MNAKALILIGMVLLGAVAAAPTATAVSVQTVPPPRLGNGYCDVGEVSVGGPVPVYVCLVDL